MRQVKFMCGKTALAILHFHAEKDIWSVKMVNEIPF